MVNLLGLIEMYNTYGQDNVYHELADALLKSYSKLDKMTTAEIAQMCNVSLSTLSRFFKKMDYPMTVSKLPQLVGQTKLNYSFDGFYSKTSEHESTESIEQYFKRIHEALYLFEASVDKDMLLSVIKDIRDIRHVIFLGCPMPQEAWRFQVDLTLEEISASAFLDPNYQYKALEQLKGKCVCIYFDNNKSSALEYQTLINTFKSKIHSLLVFTNRLRPSAACDYEVCIEGTNTEQDFILMNIFLNLLGVTFRQTQLNK